MSDTKSSRKQQLRRLSPKERREALAHGRKQGLPQDWDVEWDNKREKKIWISPDGSRKCYSLPQALKYAIKTGQTLSSSTMAQGNSGNTTTSISMRHRKLSPEEVAQKIQEGRKSGLPEGWTVVWDNMFDQRVWISPDGKKKCKGIPQALAYSIKCGLITADKIPNKKYAEQQTTNRVLSPEEVQEILQEGKEKGLPDGWSVEWNNAKQKRRWIAPDGCKVHSVPQALRMSLKKGWISKLPNNNPNNNDNNNNDPNKPTNHNNKSGKTTTAAAAASDQAKKTQHSNHHSQETSIQLSKTTTTKSNTTIPRRRRRRTQHIPSGNRQLTESEQLASREEAKARGLVGNNWKAEFHNHLNRRIWISPDDNQKKYSTIANALAGIPMSNDFSDRVKKSTTTTNIIIATQDSMSESSSPCDDSRIMIPRKRRRNDETGLAMITHTKSTKSDNAKDDENASSDGELVEYDQNNVGSVAKKKTNTSRLLSSPAGKEMQIIVERDSDNKGCTVSL